MKKSISLLSVALLGLGTIAALHSISAQDENLASKAADQLEVSDLVSLVERMETLENRVKELERAESLVRQADSRGEVKPEHPERFVPEVEPSERGQAEEEVDDDAGSKINGQKFRFFLLGNRQSANRKTSNLQKSY